MHLQGTCYQSPSSFTSSILAPPRAEGGLEFSESDATVDALGGRKVSSGVSGLELSLLPAFLDFLLFFLTLMSQSHSGMKESTYRA
jgi:hypothetical protein